MADRNPLLFALYDLDAVLRKSQGPIQDNLLERWHYFTDMSLRTDGPENCKYAALCRDLFLMHDYEKVKELLLKVLQEIRLVEGADFGK